MVIHDNDGFKYLQFHEDAQGKTYQGGVGSRNQIPHVTNVYPNYENQDRCPM